MTLPSSGTIKLSQIGTEYSDAKPHKLTEFYGKPGLPESGRIDITDFYGKKDWTKHYIAGEKVSRKFRITPAVHPIISMNGINYTLGNVDTFDDTKIVIGWSGGGLIIKQGTTQPPAGTVIHVALSGTFGETLCRFVDGMFVPDNPLDTVFNTTGAATMTLWVP